LTKQKNNINLNPEATDVFDVLRTWIGENIKHGRLKPEIFVRNGVAYRFTLRGSDHEVSYEIKNRI